MLVLSIERERVYRALIGCDVAEIDAKKFCVVATEEHFAKVKSMVDAYAGIAKRINSLQWSAFEKNFVDADGDMDEACPDPNTFPEMAVFRSMIVAIYKSIAKHYV